MDTTHEHDANTEDAGPRPGSVVFGWVAGPMALAAHLALFLAAGTILLTLDILRSPGAVSITGLLRRWSLVVVAHALVAAVVWAIGQVAAAARATEPGSDVDDTFWPTSIEPSAEAPPLSVTTGAGIDWSEHVAPLSPLAPAAVMPSSRPASRRPAPFFDDRPTGLSHGRGFADDASSDVLERSEPDVPSPSATRQPLEAPAPPEVAVFAGAPPSGRFAPPVVTPPVPEEERKPRWFDRQRRKLEDVPATEPVERTPPGWRVISSETLPESSVPLPPPPARGAPGAADDDAFTWIEAAAQAWLEHRAAATGTTGRAASSDEPDAPTAARPPDTDDDA